MIKSEEVLDKLFDRKTCEVDGCENYFWIRREGMGHGRPLPPRVKSRNTKTCGGKCSRARQDSMKEERNKNNWIKRKQAALRSN